MTDLPVEPRRSGGRWSEAWRRRAWLLIVVTVATIPVAGVFTFSRAFLVRDLVYYFWPRYRWLRQTVWAGESPWWDPFAGAGQPTAGDALGQLFLLPTLALRLLLPEPLGFNLWVALPMPLSALGTYLFFLRHGSPGAAALGGLIFAASGPMLSTGSFPNLSWAMLVVPWLLWAVDRARGASASWRTLLPVSLLYACQVCAGEPVVTAASMLLVLAYVAAGPASPAADRLAERARATGRVALALATGLAVAGVQLIPLLWAVAQSARGVLEVNTDMWSVHPLALLEAIMPQLFGNLFVAFIPLQPWMVALNSGRDAFFFSVYVGAGSLMLALLGIAHPLRRRWSAFWVVVAVGALAAALGSHTPLYPGLLSVVPALRVFRFPAKYLLFVAFAVAALAAAGWTALERRRETETSSHVGAAMRATLAAAGVVAALAYAAAMFRLAWPESFALGIYHLARFLAMPDPAGSVDFLYGDAVAHAARLFLMSALGAGLLWLAWTPRREARLAQGVLFVAIVADLVVTNRFVNPTAPVALVENPSWVGIVRQHPHERFYFGARFEGMFDFSDYDGPTGIQLPPYDAIADTRVLIASRLITVPAVFGVREIISHDLPSLFSRELQLLIRMLREARPEERRRFLGRVGVRYCLGREDGAAGRPILDRIPQLQGFGLYECHPDARRTYVASTAHVMPEIRDQLTRMFREDYDPQTVLLQAGPPAPSGPAGTPAAPGARFVSDGPDVVEIAATTGHDGGYLVLLDTYDPSWRVHVDGARAPLLRVNGVFRAVRLAPGRHRVTFTYVPVPVLYGAALSCVGALGLCLMAGLRPRVRRAAASEQPAIRVGVDAPALAASRDVDARGRV